VLRDVALARVQDGIGFRRDMVDQIILRMQEEQRDLERGKTLPSFLLVEGAMLELLSGEQAVDLPADFLRRSPIPLRYYDSPSSQAFREIPWRDYVSASAIYADYTPSGPAVAALRTTSIQFFPIADSDYSISWDYYKRDALLTSNIENLWLEFAPELIIGGAGLRLSLDLRNKEGAMLFGNMYKQARQTWFSETIVEESEEIIVLGGNA